MTSVSRSPSPDFTKAPVNRKTPRKKKTRLLPNPILMSSTRPSAAPCTVSTPLAVTTSIPSVAPSSAMRIITRIEVTAKEAASVTHMTMAKERSVMVSRPWWVSVAVLSPSEMVSGSGA